MHNSTPFRLRTINSLLFVLMGTTSLTTSHAHQQPPEPEIVEDLLIDTVWVANKVSFDLHTAGDKQFVAYYDQERNMSLAYRKTGSDEWQKTILPNVLMWDSHNYVTMGIDELGYIHVSGNMHTHPLAYFRSEKPYDISRMVELNTMVGSDEDSVTYPRFFHDPEGKLLYSYRAGSCGNGNILVNRFNTESMAWERYLKKPLFAGIEADDDRAAYHNFVKDEEGNFHFIWIWRWTPMVETSHQICYATTPDLLHWKNAAGKTVNLPFRPDDKSVIVDGTPSNGGMHNGRYKIILRKDGTPVIGYIKYDEGGLTQLYLASFRDGHWVSHKISDWDFRWHIHGGGDQMTIGGNFSFAGITEDDVLVVDWITETGASGTYTLDVHSFEPAKSSVGLPKKYPDNIRDRMSDIEGLSVNVQPGKGFGAEDGSGYVLKWESAKKSHGRHAPPVIPDGPLSELRVLKIKCP